MIVSQKTVKTRKEHRCFGCARKFPKGAQMEKIDNADEGTIHSSYWCDVCTAYWTEHMQDGEEIMYGDLKGEDPEGWNAIRELIERIGG